MDDDRSLTSVLKLYLSKHDFEVRVAADGDEAVSLLREERFELIITDIYMPKMSGWELLRHCAAHYPGMQRIAISGGALLEHRTAFPVGSPVFFLRKPFKLDHLVEIITQLRSNAPSQPMFDTATSLPRTLDPQPTLHGSRLYPFIVGGLVHDMLNTLMSASARLELLGAQRSTGKALEDRLTTTGRHLERDIEHLRRVAILLQDVSREYYRTSSEPDQHDGERIREIVEDFRRRHPGVHFTSRVDDEAFANRLPLGVLTFLTGELLANASHACAGVENAEVTLTMDNGGADRVVSIECVDNGPGLPPSTLSAIHEGTVRAPTAAGTGGYGLYLMLQLTHRLEGARLLASNQPSGGARIQILLPNEDRSR